jgi:hypothetical protein
MDFLRRRLRLFVLIWLLFQVTSLSALVPRDCCAAHRPVAEATDHCHKPAPPPECSLRGSCNVPEAVLVSLLSNHGILPSTVVDTPRFYATAIPMPAKERLVARLQSPDLPPPRA